MTVLHLHQMNGVFCSKLRSILAPRAWPLALEDLYLLLLLLAFSTGVMSAELERAERIPETLLLPKLLPSAELARLSSSKLPFVVEGEVTFRAGAVLIAPEVIFRPGSKLILAPSNFQTGADRAVYFVTGKITIENGALPPVITWLSGARAPSSPPPVGKAAPGQAGYDGAPGGDGANGAAGNSGTPGRSPPTLYFGTRQIVGGTLAIDWRGEDGGPGGVGQVGGDGGSGGSGTPASASLFDCRRGAGDGGNGGNGGNGGTGGTGGRGGNGGLFVLLATSNDIPAVTRQLKVDVSPGRGGYGGAGGSAGIGAQGGERGRSAQPYCKDDAHKGSKGADGNLGRSLSDERAAHGAAGALAVGELSESQTKAIGIWQ